MYFENLLAFNFLINNLLVHFFNPSPAPSRAILQGQENAGGVYVTLGWLSLGFPLAALYSLWVIIIILSPGTKFSHTAIGIKTRRCDSHQYDVFWWYRVNEYREMRGKWSELAPLPDDTEQKPFDQSRFLGNCPPTPPLSERFALSEKLECQCWLKLGVGGQFPRNLNWSKSVSKFFTGRLRLETRSDPLYTRTTKMVPLSYTYYWQKPITATDKCCPLSRTYNPGQKSLEQYCNIPIFLSVSPFPLKTVHHFRNFLEILPPLTLYKIKTRKKIWMHACNIKKKKNSTLMQSTVNTATF